MKIRLKKTITFMLSGLCFNAFACTNLTVSPVTGTFTANNNTTLLTGHVDVFCSNKTEDSIHINLVYRNDTNSQRADVSQIYKNGERTDDKQKILNFQMLNINLRPFEKEGLVFAPGETTQRIKYFMKPTNLSKVEAGSYSGFLPFDMEY